MSEKNPSPFSLEIGTSKAFELSSVSGTISSVSMILAAIITLCAAPFLISLIAV
ncbi:hypothetical protein DT075_01410 [Bacillus licheniformis]|nr:hypothetical protein DT075_01410 [Bacillus licheniformis]